MNEKNSIRIWEPESEWFYEANVQNKIKAYLITKGWKKHSEADTKSREHGHDLILRRYQKTFLIEVKGYPSKYYVRGKNKGQKKKTNPPTQARHWFGEILLSLILAKCKNPKLKIAMGLPNKPTYLTKWDEIRWLRKQIKLEVCWVYENGSVRMEK